MHELSTNGQLTHNESSALIWAFMGLVAILVAIGWYYIQSSISSQKEMNKTLLKMQLNQVAHEKDNESHKEDIKEIRNTLSNVGRRQEKFEKDLVYLKGKI